MHPLPNISLTLTETTTLYGNLYETNANPKPLTPLYVSIPHRQDRGRQPTRTRRTFSPTISRMCLLHMTRSWIKRLKLNWPNRCTRPPASRRSLSQNLQQEIKKLKPRKAPGMDNITSQMLKELPKEGLMKLLHIYTAVVRCNYWPANFKSAQIIMALKPGKDPTDVTSYRAISLLSTISKLLEKLISRQISIDTDLNSWVPYHQFGFRIAHSTIQQCHRITHTVNTALENKTVPYCGIPRRQPGL